jgi:pimeloyl-ACP methyl ester carboxylesterase
MDSQAMLRAFLTPTRVAASSAEAQLLLTGRSSALLCSGQSIPTWTWGKGPCVVLAHGWDSRGSHLGSFIPGLTELGFSVTLYDAPAHGDAAGSMSSVVHMGKALSAVARSLGDVSAVIAHSAGSAAALWAFDHGLAVTCSVHLAGPSTLENVISAAARSAALPPNEYQTFRTEVADFIGAAIEDMGVDRLAPALRHPGLIVHDPDDRFVPFSESEALHDLWPASKLVPVPGLGHRRILIDPRVNSECVRFIRQHTDEAVQRNT